VRPRPARPPLAGRVSRVLPEILALDPERDAQRVARLSAGVDFPWDTRRAYELALLKTFAVPSSARLLVATGELTERSAKRHDDTVAVVATLGLHGYDSPEGRAALRAMNRAHRGHPIPMEEYRYTLSLFVLEPLRWNERFGWRALSAVERRAGLVFWREVARRMGITGVPETLSALEAESRAFEAQQVGYDPANRRLFDAVLALQVRRARLPAAVLPAARAAVASLLDERTRAAFGLERPPTALQRGVFTALRFSAAAARRRGGRRTPVGVPSLGSHPGGIDWERVGPPGAGR
jgi:hypothetical protein